MFSKIAFVVVTFFLSTALCAEQMVQSQFGFALKLPDDWVMVSAKSMGDANKNETLKSLGLKSVADKEFMNSVLEKVKQGEIEYYFDKKYLKDMNKSNVNIQLAPPINYSTIDELKKMSDAQCSSLSETLTGIYKEKLEIISCQLVPSNGLPVFHYAFTLPSMKFTIIEERIPINSKYSIMFTGGSEDQLERIKRVRKVQQMMIDTFTAFLKSKAK